MVIIVSVAIAAARVHPRRGQLQHHCSPIIGMYVSAVANALSKIALDALIQRDVVETLRSSAFARSETFLQLAWVVGAAIGVLLPSNSRGDGAIGFWVAGAVLAVVAVIVVLRQRVIGRDRAHRAAAARAPRPIASELRKTRPVLTRDCWSSPRSPPSATPDRAQPGRACVGGVGPAASRRRHRGGAGRRRVRPGGLRRHRRRVRAAAASATSRWPPTIVFADLGAETAGRLRRRSLGFGAERYEVAPRAGRRTGRPHRRAPRHRPHRRHGDRHRRDRARRSPALSRRRRRGHGGCRGRRGRRAGTASRSPRCARSATSSGRATATAWRIPEALAALGAARRRGCAAMDGTGEARLLALPERHLRLPRLDARPDRGRARQSRSPTPTSTSPTPPPSAASSTWSRCPTRRCRGCSTTTAAAHRRRARAAAAGRWCSPAAASTRPRRAHGRGAERALHRLPAVPAVGGRAAAGPHRGRAVRRDHAGGARRALRRRPGHPRGPLHLPATTG